MFEHICPNQNCRSYLTLSEKFAILLLFIAQTVAINDDGDDNWDSPDFEQRPSCGGGG